MKPSCGTKRMQNVTFDGSAPVWSKYSCGLLILDNLESLKPERRDQVFTFISRLPRSCKAIVTSVQLEPPFRPFDGHYLPLELIEDDGRIESPGSWFAGTLSKFLGLEKPTPAPSPQEEVEEPETEPAGPAAGLVELQIALPPDYQPQGNVFEQFIFSIRYARGPIAFEVIGSAKELVVQVTTWVEDSEPVRQQLKAFFPEAVVLKTRDCLATIMGQDGGIWQVVDFGLEREFMPHRETRHDGRNDSRRCSREG